MVFLRSPFTHDQVPLLVHGRVMLRYPSPNDFEEWVKLRQASKSFIIPWEPLWSENEYSKFNFRARIKHYQQQIRNDVGYPFFIFHHEQGHLLGAITASNVRRGVAQMCSVGYWIGQPFARQGFMGEALTALVEHAFGGLGLHRVEAACLPSNVASIGLLRRSGFVQEGFAVKYLQIAGKWQDHMLFARLNSRD
jgi:[ribosomal protein S5]-alanine N-acetyltransferase